MTAPDTTDESAFDLRARAELALAFDPGPHGGPPPPICCATRPGMRAAACAG